MSADPLSRLPILKLAVIVAVGMAAAISALLVIFAPPSIHVFEGLSGPAEPASVPVERPADHSVHGGGADSRLAVLLTEENSSWLGLAHGLKSIGVPFRITKDHREALKDRVLLVYPTVSGSVLSANALRELAAHLRQGER